MKRSLRLVISILMLVALIAT
ncbi:hypothetical protein Gotri_013037 [Gossypium trilobum]|nr:hypothetical protein [Gossypium trilobum]